MNNTEWNKSYIGEYNRSYSMRGLLAVLGIMSLSCNLYSQFFVGPRLGLSFNTMTSGNTLEFIEASDWGKVELAAGVIAKKKLTNKWNLGLSADYMRKGAEFIVLTGTASALESQCIFRSNCPPDSGILTPYVENLRLFMV